MLFLSVFRRAVPHNGSRTKPRVCDSRVSLMSCLMSCLAGSFSTANLSSKGTQLPGTLLDTTPCPKPFSWYKLRLHPQQPRLRTIPATCCWRCPRPGYAHSVRPCPSLPMTSRLQSRGVQRCATPLVVERRVDELGPSEMWTRLANLVGTARDRRVFASRLSRQIALKTRNRRFWCRGIILLA